MKTWQRERERERERISSLFFQIAIDNTVSK
jgi:hypothetical protein